MALAPCSCTTTFNQWAPVPRAKLSSPRSTLLRTSRAPTTWTSWATTAEDRALGMALVGTTRRTTPSGCNVRPGHAATVDGSSVATGGRGPTLAEVIAVDISNLNNQNPGKPYGTITVTDGLGALQLYNQDEHNHQEVGPRPNLAYPPRAISAADHFVIDVDITDNSRSVALGQVIWNSRDAPSREYNRILKRQVTGEYGDVEIKYAVLPNAVVVEVVVVLVDSGNFIFSADVYRSITATTTMASGEQLNYILFDNERDQAVNVPNKTTIPLQRKIMSAQLGSTFEVDINLWDSNRLGPDYQMVKGTAFFTPRINGTDSVMINGPRGKVRVEVTWST